ncbi:uncharacterized protein LOC113321924 [Papaver somniferum]|uniref:uncharacterized protein LOC113321924 n=1 Tax=Papaver somniferum TaxID=3469 RepID=UPI000E6F8D28|nr:uncharacterized protein LOC113321924 [Papaver somniferum]
MIIMRNPWIMSHCQLKKVILNLELLRSAGVPQANTSKLLTPQPITFTGDADRFKEIVEKVKEMGFDPWKITFLIAIHGFASMSEANWIKKLDVYKRWGWSEDQIQSAFRKSPRCMMTYEKKIMAVMNFLVNDMGCDSSSIADSPKVLDCSLKERSLPRCSVIRILLFRGLIKDILSLRSLSVMANKSFLDKFVHDYELEVPELMKVFLGQLSYQDLVRN